MKMNRIFVALLTVLPLLSPAQNKQPFAFTHITVIDCTGAPAMPDMDVVIADNRISAIGKSGTVTIPEDAIQIESRGKFLIPGLCDMHVHLFNHVTEGPSGDFYFGMLIATGITSVRDMWTMVDEIQKIQEWRKQFEQGNAVPRILQAGTLIDGSDPIWPNADTVATENDARQMVQKIKASGIDFVKVYWNLPRNIFFSIADECKKQSLPFAGHVPFAIKAVEASDAGQASIEHLTEIPLACSANEDKLRKIKAEDWGTKYEKEILESYDDAKCQKLFSTFVKNKTYQVPTMVVYHRTIVEEKELVNDERLKYIPLSKREEWKSFNKMMAERSPEQIEYSNHLWQTQVKLVRDMQHAGVKFMAGTDMGIAVSYIYPGFSLHDELALLVQAGFTPMEALQTATRNSAEFVGKLDSLGTVEKGKIADLVVLNANPLEDIRNTKLIDSVILNGKLFTKQNLQDLLNNVEAIAKKSD